MTTISGFLDKFEKGNVEILRKMGYTIHYAANTEQQHYLFDDEEIKKLGVHIHHIDIERSPYMVRANRKAFLQLTKIVRKYNISIIHCHTPVGGLLGRLIGKYFRKDGIKVIYTAHGFHFYKGAPWINNSVYYLAERWLARHTDILVVINREDLESARKFRLRKNGKIYRIPGAGLDTQRFHIFSEEERRRRRQALGIGEEVFFIVSVGELNENKNQEIILEALALMQDRGCDISKIVYGICGDGFFRNRLETRVRELGLQENVKMFGYCSDVPAILGCADMSVLSSRREGLGMAALESLAMGVPVAAADNRGTREYMEDGRNGYVCSCKDAESFIRGIGKIRNMDGEARRKMGIRCRKTTEGFEKARTASVMREVYKIAEKMVMEAQRNGKAG